VVAGAITCLDNRGPNGLDSSIHLLSAVRTKCSHILFNQLLDHDESSCRYILNLHALARLDSVS
jgi:hypothetical protein